MALVIDSEKTFNKIQHYPLLDFMILYSNFSSYLLIIFSYLFLQSPPLLSLNVVYISSLSHRLFFTTSLHNIIVSVAQIFAHIYNSHSTLSSAFQTYMHNCLCIHSLGNLILNMLKTELISYIYSHFPRKSISPLVSSFTINVSVIRTALESTVLVSYLEVP